MLFKSSSGEVHEAYWKPNVDPSVFKFVGDGRSSGACQKHPRGDRPKVEFLTCCRNALPGAWLLKLQAWHSHSQEAALLASTAPPAASTCIVHSEGHCHTNTFCMRGPPQSGLDCRSGSVLGSRKNVDLKSGRSGICLP